MANEIWRINSIGHALGGIRILNTWRYWVEVTGPGLIDVQDILAGFDVGVAPALLNCLTNEFTYDETFAVCEEGPDAETFGARHALAGSLGQQTGTSAFYSECMMLKTSSVFAQRWGRGRKFLSPVPASLFNDDGSVSGDTSIFGDILTAVLDGLVATELELFPIAGISPLGTAALLFDAALSGLAGIRRSRRERLGT